MRRHRLTLDFLASCGAPKRILDLGMPNDLGRAMERQGYTVENTDGDLDLYPEAASRNADAVTAFEILEHLVSPFGVLRAITAPRLFVTVPLRLWFATAYRGDDPWDRHFHEFEPWQFDWLLEKAGWRIVRREKWTSPIAKVGFRPRLRLVTPRFCAVEAIRHEDEFRPGFEMPPT